ncbi:MAG: fumarylacetoacetate hydrolase family protein [Candidatus Zixiibacteriota bacterium]|nr:MAG: fumarylacetoacetate hydrolase family protein [candidate division Zixibacteria bacterium]
MKKYVRVKYNNNIVWGAIEGDSVVVLDAAPWKNPSETGERIEFNEEILMASAEPTKIVLIGLNYRDHIKESQSADDVPKEPVIFMKPTTAIIGPNDEIPYPPGLDRVDYEGELACVIGERIHDVDEDGARNAIFGYTILNDVTARKLQKKDVQWTRGKGFDGFAPVGPYIVTGIDPLDLKIETYLNEELRQSARTSLQIWNVYQLVSFISKVMTLLPGDIVSTGTPKGVGSFKPGDTVRIEIENIGTLENRVRKL